MQRSSKTIFVAVCTATLVNITSMVSCYAIEQGRPAPAFKAKTLSGQSMDLASTMGDVVLINFWATWCAPCRKEMPAMETYYRQHKAQGFRIIAVSMDDPSDEPKVREVMKAFTFPAALARDADFDGYGRIWRMPMTFVIDRQGILRKDGGVGTPVHLDQATLDRLVSPLLVKTGGK
jgi:peroxiredoxin